MTQRITLNDVLERRNIKATLKENKKGSKKFAGPCPICGGTDRFAVDTKNELFNCRGCKEGGKGAINLIKFLDGGSYETALNTLREMGGGCDVQHHNENNKPVTTSQNFTDYALRIWRESRSPFCTPVEIYLRSRGLVLPPLCEAIRFNPSCPFGKDNDGRNILMPAMIALVRNIKTNKPQAIHRTALNGIIVKDRMALGPIGDGAVKITADEDVTYGVGIGEGIETTLSLQQLPEWQGAPVWSLLNANGVEKFPLLSGIETLMIAVDHDERGHRAATAVTERWHNAECEVLLVRATTPGADINDVVQKGRAAS